MAEPTNHNDAQELAPSTVEKQAPSVAKENAPSTDETQATDIPTANAPDPETVNPETPDAAGVDQPAQTKPPGKPAKASAVPPKGDKPPAKAGKKEKGPAVEDKPFAEFIQQDYLPALKKTLAAQGVQELELTFAKQKIPIAGYNPADQCWQVMGRWQNGMRQFNIYFPDEDIKKQRAFSCNEGTKPSTLEPFLIDERTMTLDLMVYGVIQRLNGQKWLEREINATTGITLEILNIANAGVIVNNHL